MVALVNRHRLLAFHLTTTLRGEYLGHKYEVERINIFNIYGLTLFKDGVCVDNGTLPLSYNMNTLRGRVEWWIRRSISIRKIEEMDNDDTNKHKSSA